MKFDFLFTNSLFNKSVYKLYIDWYNFKSKDKLFMFTKSLLGVAFFSLSFTLLALAFNFTTYLSYIDDLNFLYTFIFYTVGTFVGYFIYPIALMFRINQKLNFIYKNQKEFINYIKELNFQLWSTSSQKEFLTALCEKDLIAHLSYFHDLENSYNLKINKAQKQQTEEQVQKILDSFKEEPKQDKAPINFFND